MEISRLPVCFGTREGPHPPRPREITPARRCRVAVLIIKNSVTVHFGRRRSCARPRASAAPQQADHPLPYINRLFSANSRRSPGLSQTAAADPTLAFRARAWNGSSCPKGDLSRGRSADAGGRPAVYPDCASTAPLAAFNAVMSDCWRGAATCPAVKRQRVPLDPDRGTSSPPPCRRPMLCLC